MEQLWGAVPVVCTLAEADASDKKATHTRAYSVPRQSFFYLHMESIKESFSRLVDREQCVWLADEEGRPLPWHMPVSAVIDALAVARRCPAEAVLPLRLTVHFTLPSGKTGDLILKVKDDRIAKVAFYQRLKSSAICRFGSVEPLVAMQASQLDEYDWFFTALKNNDPVAYNLARKKLDTAALVVNALQHEGGTATPDGIGGLLRSMSAASSALRGTLPAAAMPTAVKKVAAAAPPETRIPLVLHVAGPSSGAFAAKPVVHSLQNVGKKTLGLVLKELLPTQMASVAAESLLDTQRANKPLDPSVGLVLVQGVQPLLSTPLEFLYDRLAATDGYLHVAVTFATVRSM